MKRIALVVSTVFLLLGAALPARAQYITDDIVRFVTPVAGLTLGAMGVPVKHPFRERVAVMATSGAFVVGSVYGLKAIVHRERPDGLKNDSFPSGHTAIAFWGAEIVREEYGWGWGSGAYVLAAGVGALRIYHEQHWLTDVLAGAALGVLCARLGYLLLPWERRIFGWDMPDNLTILPTYAPGPGAVQLTVSKYF